MSLPYLLDIPRFSDERGWVSELWRVDMGIPLIQDNLAWSRQGCLRGLHYQLNPPQGKLLHVLSGQIYDVVLDLRRTSTTFGQWTAFTLHAEESKALWIPPGYAHGFYVQSPEALVNYKLSQPRDVVSERVIAWDDPDLKIPWPLNGPPILSPRDAQGQRFYHAATDFTEG